MVNPFRFQKIMDVKENEKEQSLAEYNQSVNDFENVANKLYDSLKQKEVLEETTLARLNSGMSVQEIRHYQQFVSNIEKTITHYQKLVQLTRNRMNEKQMKLMQKNIEVKKYEKLKEKQLEQYILATKHSENKQMDDLSIQSYMYRGS
ncbi:MULTISPECIES: flagellar export protein FliJ [Bacillaceae]|uniref:Flagellar FliJ protein n=1 Tax=Metabacillus endolithicus TaxID=1535204 RepID=A0ABW5BTI0_9BACI|nr:MULTISPECIES: flagellar export protein FliJ [Bacillaceae]PGT86667.1 flagellar export protein FliJ [Bacillus sp. AFS040349]UGB32673.1 flagellar biosynthesis chaperone FliJ [Metabacillus sp. B2-18]UPG63255.1 flagellar biosynthesis chaperone FliJ [Metabacillus endolithicus]